MFCNPNAVFYQSSVFDNPYIRNYLKLVTFFQFRVLKLFYGIIEVMAHQPGSLQFDRAKKMQLRSISITLEKDAQLK